VKHVPYGLIHIAQVQSAGIEIIMPCKREERKIRYKQKYGKPEYPIRFYPVNHVVHMPVHP
jgi:hypothetical protein